MADKSHNAIAALCDIIARMPYDHSANAIMWAAMAVNYERDPTGLQQDGTRSDRQLYWDITIDDLKLHLRNMVVNSRISQDILAVGIASHIKTYYRQRSDPDFAERASANNAAKLVECQQQLELPQQERDLPISDKELVELIDLMRDHVDNAESKRLESERICEYLEPEFDTVFTPSFLADNRHGF